MDPAAPHIWDLPHLRPDPVPRAQGASDQQQEAPPPQASRSGGTGSSPQPGKHQVRDGDIGLTDGSKNITGQEPFLNQYLHPDDLVVNEDYLLYPALTQ
ncbi:hypothetical protein RUM43_001808 [Polyplax serrata]|uniref:Uncharacterized protein n=1 Tax=Polyplax serrata TaxID=468196 RepID=A0AAN8SGS7_POLSC